MLFLAGCSGDIKKEASYPTRMPGSDKIVYSDSKRDTVWGAGKNMGSKIFGKDGTEQSGSGIGVNTFLWRASLDTISFMPVVSADPFGGVILTDWYENSEVPGERFKINVYILDRQLRADGIRVSIFKQKQTDTNSWKDVAVDKKMSFDIESTILTRARELKITQQSAK